MSGALAISEVSERQSAPLRFPARRTEGDEAKDRIARSAKGFAWQRLVARRLAERGVRFIEQIDTGSSNNWEAHDNLKSYEGLARNVDPSIAGLLIIADL